MGDAAGAHSRKAAAVLPVEWQGCSAEEKLLLIQLVEEGYANPKQDEVVRKLVKAACCGSIRCCVR
jgi:hypothetical protein